MHLIPETGMSSEVGCPLARSDAWFFSFLHRSRRTRKAVNYTFDAFDAEIKRAIRSDGQRQEDGWPEARSRRGQPEPSAFPKLSR